MKPDRVRNEFGEGRLVGAREAVRLGMADRIGTLEEVVAQLLTGRISGVGQVAAANEPLLSAENERAALALRERVEKILRKE